MIEHNAIQFHSEMNSLDFGINHHRLNVTFCKFYNLHYFCQSDAPVCRYERILVVGASRGETLDIKCEVEADPPVVHFRWKFNNSGETLEVSSDRFYSEGPSSSVLRYTTASELDYGSLSCWAVNAVGHQVAPCVFQVCVFLLLLSCSKTRPFKFKKPRKKQLIERAAIILIHVNIFFMLET